MELVFLVILGALALWIFAPRSQDTPLAGFAPTGPGDNNAQPRRPINVTEYWDERGDPPTFDERVQQYLAQCTASRPCVATSPRYDVDSYATSRRERQQAIADNAVPVENWPRREKRQKQEQERGRWWI